MPTGPNGQTRLAEVIGAAVHVAKIATDEMNYISNNTIGTTRRRNAGVSARAKALTRQQRTELAKKSAAAWWE